MKKNKIVAGIFLTLSLFLSAEAMNFYSNDAAKENQKKSDVLSKNISGLDSLIWILTHNSKHFERDPNWKLDPEQARADGLGFMTVNAALSRGDLVSQASYDELVRINRLDEFHSKNIKHRFGEPVKIIGLIIVLFISFLLLRKLVKNKD